MTTSEYLRRYLRSPLGIGFELLGALVGLALWAGGLPAPLSLLAAVGLGLAFGAAALLTGLGPRAAARQAEREAEAAGEARRRSGIALRERLERLRLADPELAAARDLLCLEAGRLLERPSPELDPRLPAALAEALELVQAWLREADESAVERRFGAPDAHPFPSAKERVLAALAERTILAVRLRDRAMGAAPDILARDEELR